MAQRYYRRTSYPGRRGVPGQIEQAIANTAGDLLIRKMRPTDKKVLKQVLAAYDSKKPFVCYIHVGASIS